MSGPSVAGVVLAAGASSRFDADRPKQLADWFGETLVHRATRIACARLDPVLVVVGHRADAIRDAVDDLVEAHGVRVVTNGRWRAGQSTSVRAAVESLGALNPRTVEGAIFLPCDQPGLDESVIDALLDAWNRRGGSVRALVPTYLDPDGTRRRGAPAIFASTLFPRLRSLTGDEGGRQILRHLGEALGVVDLPDAARGDDVDTVDDLKRLRRTFSWRTSSQTAGESR